MYIRTLNFLKMKRLGILLATAAMLTTVSMSAQVEKGYAYSRESSKEMRPERPMHKVYGELTVTNNNGRVVIKVDFNEMLLGKMSRDRDILEVTSELASHKYASLSEALNVLSSHGWEVEEVWTQSGKMANNTNFLISKSVSEVTPLYPWRAVKSKGAVKGTTKAKK